MINASEMYRISGGCTIGRICGECANCIDGKEPACIVYPKDQAVRWNTKRTACKYFRERAADGQIDISDWIKEGLNSDR